MAALEPTFKDYYEVLHLHPEADAAMVDQAYWHLARLYNAAIPTDGAARPMLEELNEAYGVLRTPELRAEYDELRDAVLGVGALPEPRTPSAEPPPLSVMQKQKAKPRDPATHESQPVDQETPSESLETRSRIPRLDWKLSFNQISAPNWQAAVKLLSMLILAGAAIAAGAEPALVLFALIVGVGFTVIPIMAKAPRFPALPRPQVALPTIGPPRFAERLPRSSIDTDRLRLSTEAMLAHWRDSTPVSAGQPTTPAPTATTPDIANPSVEPPLEQATNSVDTERLRQSLRESTEAIRARLREASEKVEEDPSQSG
jgi:hypothetical protein